MASARPASSARRWGPWTSSTHSGGGPSVRRNPTVRMPSALPSRATSRPISPRPTRNRVCPDSSRKGWRTSGQALARWSSMSLGRSLAMASSPKMANSASGTAWTPLEVVMATRSRASAGRPALRTCSPAPALVAWTQRSPGRPVTTSARSSAESPGTPNSTSASVQQGPPAGLAVGVAAERRVAAVVGRVAGRREEIGLEQHLGPRVGRLDPGRQLGLQRRGDQHLHGGHGSVRPLDRRDDGGGDAAPAGGVGERELAVQLLLDQRPDQPQPEPTPGAEAARPSGGGRRRRRGPRGRPAGRRRRAARR